MEVDFSNVDCREIHVSTRLSRYARVNETVWETSEVKSWLHGSVWPSRWPFFSTSKTCNANPFNWDFTVVHVTPRNMGWYHRIEGNSSPGRCLNNHYHLGCNMWVSSELWLLLLGVEWWFIQWLSGVWLVGSNVCTFPSIGKPPPASTNKQLGSFEWLSRNPTLTWRFLGQIYVGVFC